MKPRKILKSTIGILAAILLISAVPAFAQDDSQNQVQARSGDYSYVRIVRLSYVEGDVQISPADGSGWQAASANMPLRQGDAIGTGDGRAEIEFENGATARLAEKSVLTFTQLALSDGGRITEMNLSQGTATFYANLQSGDWFVVDAPQFQVSIPQRGEVRVDVLDSGSVASVLKGTVEVTSAAGQQEVSKGRTVSLDASEGAVYRIAPNPAPDDWDSWVEGRESALEQGVATAQQYANAPFEYGLADLSAYGAWNNYEGYGYGWQPAGVGCGWSPYLNGYWQSYSGFGLTWISSDPWGWVPYHFGYWENFGNCGWVWFPAYFDYWCPERVEWVRSGGNIGWRPRPTPLTMPVGSGKNKSGIPPASPMRHGNWPVIVSSSGKLGDPRHNHLLTGDELNKSKTELMPAPPIWNGRRAEFSPSPAASKPGTTGTTAVLVPIGRGTTGTGTGIVYDPNEHRYVNSSAPAAPARTPAQVAPPNTPAPPSAPAHATPPSAPATRREPPVVASPAENPPSAPAPSRRANPAPPPSEPRPAPHPAPPERSTPPPSAPHPSPAPMPHQTPPSAPPPSHESAPPSHSSPPPHESSPPSHSAPSSSSTPHGSSGGGGHH
ncbi:MAG: DUF6600 domain-containing protein [Candidatus Acidiferrales bacterium]